MTPGGRSAAMILGRRRLRLRVVPWDFCEFHLILFHQFVTLQVLTACQYSYFGSLIYAWSGGGNFKEVDQAIGINEAHIRFFFWGEK